MASRLNPYVSFDGNAREALEHYQRVLGGDLAADTPPGMEHQPGNNIAG
jgi:PhnB protein